MVRAEERIPKTAEAKHANIKEIVVPEKAGSPEGIET